MSENQQVFFKGIQGKIVEFISNAEHEIIIAVAWITDEYILGKLLNKSKNGVSVSILFYDDRINNKNLFKELFENGARIKHTSKLMHNKFCIIDNYIVINGSYNWTNNASSNNENIQITINSPHVTREYLNEFEKLFGKAKSINEFFKTEENKYIEFLIEQSKPKSYPVFHKISFLNVSPSLIKNIVDNKEYHNLKYIYVLFKTEDDYNYYNEYLYNRKKRNENFKYKELKLDLFPEIYDFDFTNNKDYLDEIKEIMFIEHYHMNEIELFDKKDIALINDLQGFKINRIPLTELYERVFHFKIKFPKSIDTIKKFKTHVFSLREKLDIKTYSLVAEELILYKIYFGLPFNFKIKKGYKILEDEIEDTYFYFKRKQYFVENFTKQINEYGIFQKKLYLINDIGIRISNEILFEEISFYKNNILILNKNIKSYYTRNLLLMTFIVSVYLIRENWIYYSIRFNDINYYGILDCNGKMILEAQYNYLISEKLNEIKFQNVPYAIFNTDYMKLSSYYNAQEFKNKNELVLNFIYGLKEKKYIKYDVNTNQHKYLYMSDHHVYSHFNKSLIGLTGNIEEINRLRNRAAVHGFYSDDLKNLMIKDLDEIRRFNKENSKFCYIATMVYKDTEHPKVEYLRTFRDNKLSQNYFGIIFIKLYYRYSPRFVEILKNKVHINLFLKKTLDILIKILQKIE
ncbi:phospholipase D-like domain-containing protein [Flavobacterium yafengii]|uniref:phospholipase D-like domain-containing protein n=1 Tax=Flavobacterium yafengii TaxID=3041253 RepID=UPI0024A93DC2|nr:phospholipase D-like domain-containing protein [Flavobacterium yafengii]MDI5897825.1 phospholipase D-like domain-containing protein [Flavobacterium yafengii]MDI6048011.1 phospholipase D-like domain-containing protein [Flavobacterium yafengii]